jgi:hypothetical protein
MSNVLLGLWIALIGADRIDLAGGQVPFVLTPFLVLTPFVVLSQAWRRRREGLRLAITRRVMIYSTTAAALLTIVLISVFVSQDVEISASRASLLIANLVATFFVVLLTVDRPDAARVLARGAAASLLLFLAFDVAEVLGFIGRTAESIRLGPALIKFGDLQSIGLLPRLAGPVGDANRGGFVLLLSAVLIGRGERNAVVRAVALFVIVVLILATMSRSAMLAAMATLVATILLRTSMPSPRTLITIGLVAAAGLTFVLLKPNVFDRVAAVVMSPVTERLSSGEESAQTHVVLIERGLSEATQSIPRAAIGVGYGTSHLVLQDVFPGDKHGNFHSLYITMFAESGVGALILMLVLLFTPLAIGGPWRALIAGAIAFNVFYQTPAEPAFWFLLASAWLVVPQRAALRDTPP